MKQRGTGGHAIQSAFVFALIGLFAILSLLVIIMGTRAYRAVVDRSDHSQRQRTAFAYVVNRARGADAAGAIASETLDGVSALAIRQNEDEDTYVTRFYVYDGMLTEQLSMAEDAFDPEDGEALIEARSLDVSVDASGRMRFAITLSDGETLSTGLTMRSASR